MTINKIDQLKTYAQANYDSGMDFYVECFSDEEWVDFLEQSNNCLQTAKANMREMAEIQLEKESNAINSAF